MDCPVTIKQLSEGRLATYKKVYGIILREIRTELCACCYYSFVTASPADRGWEGLSVRTLGF